MGTKNKYRRLFERKNYTTSPVIELLLGIIGIFFILTLAWVILLMIVWIFSITFTIASYIFLPLLGILLVIALIASFF